MFVVKLKKQTFSFCEERVEKSLLVAELFDYPRKVHIFSKSALSVCLYLLGVMIDT